MPKGQKRKSARGDKKSAKRGKKNGLLSSSLMRGTDEDMLISSTNTIELDANLEAGIAEDENIAARSICDMSVRVNPDKIGNMPVRHSVFDFQVQSVTTPRVTEQVLAAHGTPPAQVADLTNSCLFSPASRRPSPRSAFNFPLHPMSPSWSQNAGTPGLGVSVVKGAPGPTVPDNTQGREKSLQVIGKNVWIKPNTNRTSDALNGINGNAFVPTATARPPSHHINANVNVTPALLNPQNINTHMNLNINMTSPQKPLRSNLRVAVPPPQPLSVHRSQGAVGASTGAGAGAASLGTPSLAAASAATKANQNTNQTVTMVRTAANTSTLNHHHHHQQHQNKVVINNITHALPAKLANGRTINLATAINTKATPAVNVTTINSAYANHITNGHRLRVVNAATVAAAQSAAAAAAAAAQKQRNLAGNSAARTANGRLYKFAKPAPSPRQRQGQSQNDVNRVMLKHLKSGRGLTVSAVFGSNSGTSGALAVSKDGMIPLTPPNLDTMKNTMKILNNVNAKEMSGNKSGVQVSGDKQPFTFTFDPSNNSNRMPNTHTGINTNITPGGTKTKTASTSDADASAAATAATPTVDAFGNKLVNPNLVNDGRLGRVDIGRDGITPPPALRDMFYTTPSLPPSLLSAQPLASPTPR